jgi:hypothetical protein
MIDAELNRLPPLYREPLVLCDIEGRPRKEVAQQLGIPEGTLSSRLTAARKKLAARLVRRGLAVTAATLSAMLPAGEALATEVPPQWLADTVRAGSLAAAGQAVTGVVPEAVARLAEETARSLGPVRVAVAATLLTCVATVATAVAFAVAPTPSDPADRRSSLNQDNPPGPGVARADPVPGGFRKQVERTDWLLTAVDPKRRTIAVSDTRGNQREAEAMVVIDDKGKGGLMGMTLGELPVSPDAVVELDGKPSVFAALHPGMRARLRLSTDRLAVERIECELPALPPGYVLVAVDPVQRTVTVASPETRENLGPLPVPAGTRIELFGLKDQVATFQTGTLDDLRLGSFVRLDIVIGADGPVVRRIRSAK